jgi:two-component system KDP operon response regulator KdpE
VSAERVLVIDDDRALLRALAIGLRARDYEVDLAASGSEGLERAALFQPHVVVLDMSLPDLDGAEVCARLRQFSDVPVLVLSALGDERRKVEVLDIGADDYVTKPFGMAELEARLRVLLRRPRGVVPLAPPVIVVGPLTIDLPRKSALLDDAPLTLTAKEFAVLAFLARSVGQVCTQQMILREVWGRGYASEANYLRVYAHRIRRKLGVHGAMFVTHPGIGYELVDSAGASSVSSSA